MEKFSMLIKLLALNTEKGNEQCEYMWKWKVEKQRDIVSMCDYCTLSEIFNNIKWKI